MMTSEKKKNSAPKANARITEEEHELLLALSQQQGVTPSDYIRKSLRQKMMEDILSITKIEMTEGSPVEIRDALTKLIGGDK